MIKHAFFHIEEQQLVKFSWESKSEMKRFDSMSRKFLFLFFDQILSIVAQCLLERWLVEMLLMLPWYCSRMYRLKIRINSIKVKMEFEIRFDYSQRWSIEKSIWNKERQIRNHYCLFFSKSSSASKLLFWSNSPCRLNGWSLK